MSINLVCSRVVFTLGLVCPVSSIWSLSVKVGRLLNCGCLLMNGRD